jgi:hypothetical protein
MGMRCTGWRKTPGTFAVKGMPFEAHHACHGILSRIRS